MPFCVNVNIDGDTITYGYIKLICIMFLIYKNLTKQKRY